MTLADLPRGRWARIAQVRVAGATGDRFAELGLTAGTSIRVIRHGPFGDPVQVAVRGFLLAVRRAEATAIDVQVDAGGTSG